jgi:hypothetical protein
MNEELTLAIEELRQYPTNRAWFIPVKLSNCEIPDRNIGAGETLRDIQWVELYEDWEKGIKNILKVVSDIKKPYPKSGNEIILDTSRPMKERMQDVTEAWMNSGKRADLLVNGKSFFAAQCWSYDNRVYSPKHENYDEGMVDFIAASRSSIGGDKGWDAILREHTLCDMCRENYRFENIQICTGCMRYTCYKCADYYHKSCNDQVVG